MKDHSEDLKLSYEKFISSEPVTPPRALSEAIRSRVHRDLHPRFWFVFLKLFSLHAVVGGATLLFCPQFGVSLIPGLGISGLFIRWGAHACMLGCGATFAGASLLAASLVLRPEEVRAIRETRLLQLTLLSLLSVGVFLFAGASMILSMGAAMALLWVLGSVLGGLAALELGWAIRRSIIRSAA